ncbi:hypothetical protein FJZ26_04595 [Candidatus Parvarchaeota archaeon]|nr:hypothetical protein [Candidatus Parvarchaeota archaeon]
MELLVKDGALEKMLPEFWRAAEFLQQQARKCKKVIIRYHNDADGICSALCISQALKLVEQAQRQGTGEAGFAVSANESRSATYFALDAQEDALRASDAGARALFVFVDFASNQESANGLRELRQSAPGCSMMLVDHHPVDAKTRGQYDFVLTQFDYGASTNYSAGVLCAHLAGACLKLSEKGQKDSGYLKLLCDVSLVADKSTLVRHTKKLEQIAHALDYAAMQGKQKSLEQFKKIVFGGPELDELIGLVGQQAGQLQQAAQEFSRMKKIGRFKVSLIQVDKLAGKYPGLGRAKAVDGIFWQQNRGNESEPLVAIGHGDRLVTFRANKAAIDAGFAATKIVAHIEQDLKGALMAGGGHDSAASLRLHAGFGTLVYEEVLKMIEKI